MRYEQNRPNWFNHKEIETFHPTGGKKKSIFKKFFNQTWDSTICDLKTKVSLLVSWRERGTRGVSGDLVSSLGGVWDSVLVTGEGEETTELCGIGVGEFEWELLLGVPFFFPGILGIQKIFLIDLIDKKDQFWNNGPNRNVTSWKPFYCKWNNKVFFYRTKKKIHNICDWFPNRFFFFFFGKKAFLHVIKALVHRILFHSRQRFFFSLGGKCTKRRRGSQIF